MKDENNGEQPEALLSEKPEVLKSDYGVYMLNGPSRAANIK